VNCGLDIYNAFTAQHIQASIFNWTYLRCYWKHLDISVRVILQKWCQIQCTSSRLRYVNFSPDIYNVTTVPHIQNSIINWTHLRCYRRHLDNTMSVILQTWCQIQRTSSCLRYMNCVPGHKQCSYSSAYLDFNIQLNVSPLLLEICRHFGARYISNLVPNIAYPPVYAMW
jgi:hypothetical protein